MKTLFLLLCSAVAISTQAQVSSLNGSGPAGTIAKPTDYVITDRGPNHCIWSLVVWETTLSGEQIAHTNTYTELATGMNYLDPQSGQWIESHEVIEGFPGGAVARQGQIQVIFANDLATAGAIDLQTPDGKRLTSHVTGLSYFDAASGTNILIASVKDCQGKILPPNQVLYEDAFDGLKASVRYTYTRGGFEQDIILLESPASPEAYGLNPATTRLVVMTEFLNPPQPAVEESVLTDSAGGPMEDDTLDFGALQIGSGSGFLLGPSATGPGLKVWRQWAELEGRQFLLEQVPAVDLFKAINSLPGKQGASLESTTKAIRFTASTRQLPSHKPVKADTKAMQLASGHLPQKGYVLDYFTVISTNNFTFQNDTTYYVSGSVNLSGTTMFEGGTVIKFAPTNNACLNVATALCRGSMYRPSILTARDDDTVGQTISGSTGNPTTNFYARAMLALGNNSPLSYLRMSYAAKAVEFNGGDGYSLSHAQLNKCQLALNILNDNDNAFTLNNVLMCNVANLGTAGNFSYYGAHLTFDHVTNQAAASCSFTNSLFAATAAFSGGRSNAYFSSGSGVFQTVGAASYYLIDGSTNRNAGTTNLAPSFLTELKKRTTYPPMVLTNNITTDTTLSPQAQRDTDIPDLGYHYDPLDYVASGVRVLTNTLVLTNGVALATYGNYYGGLRLESQGVQGGRLVSGGLADHLNYIVRYNTVQEQSSTNWASTVGPSVYLLSSYASAECRFTGWSIPGGSSDHFENIGESAMASFQHCQFNGGTFTITEASAALTNCLWERVGLSFYEDTSFAHWYLQNNLLRGGAFSYEANNAGSGGIASDNLFDRTAINGSGGAFTNGYNGYVTNCSRLSNTQGNDVILTNSPIYQTSYLGNNYYPTNGGLLSRLIDAGSRWATNAGLYHFTTTTNQVKEGATKVDIGFHYVAVDPATGQPYDTDGDGIPDYLEDANGDGVYGTGDLTDWRSYNSPNGFTGASGLQVFTPLK